MFNKSQINELIKKIWYVAEKNNNIINISSYEDSAQLAAYIAGFNSITEFLNKEEEIDKQNNQSIFKFDKKYENFIDENFLEKDLIVQLNFEEIHNLTSFLNKFEKNYIIKESKENINLFSKLNIGYKYNNITKFKEPIYLNNENTLIHSENNFFINNIRKQIIEQKQCVISFKDIKEINIEDNNSILFLDPVNEIFNGLFLEEFFENEILNHKSFIFIWFLMIQQIKEKFNIKFNLDLLVKTIDLKFIVTISTILAKEANFLSSLILNYIKSLSNVVMEKNTIKIPYESMKKHQINCEKIISLFNYFNYGYKNNIFRQNNLILCSAMLDKNSIDIYIDKNPILKMIIENSINKYDKLVSKLDVKLHNVFIIDEVGIINIPVKSNYVIQFIQNNQFNEFNQIIFGKQTNFTKFNSDFIGKIIFNTKNIEKNIFYSDGVYLQFLDKENGFLLKKTKPNEEIYELISFKS